MSVETKNYTEADLKKLPKDELVAIAVTEKGLHIVPDETTIPKIIKAILEAQDEQPIPDEPTADSGNAPADKSANPGDPGNAPETASSEADPGNVPVDVANVPVPADQPSSSPTGVNLGIDAPLPAPAPKPKATEDQLTVVSTQKEAGKNGGFKVAFWERNSDHPDGEVWIADDQPHIVGRTRAITQAILDGKIEEVK